MRATKVILKSLESSTPLRDVDIHRTGTSDASTSPPTFDTPNSSNRDFHASRDNIEQDCRRVSAAELPPLPRHHSHVHDSYRGGRFIYFPPLP
ncbi:hypothetical protein EVAR_22287_1 [Eumeta japonica]|uniref:Uncharacterized protein n=1 Tax=Eumeta variegata TaxID=151549 RepID=A0A4C1UAR4_EUMVA|nr:hypothetical protein EVAR_22287_1 [Eumeta japonica]